MESIERAAGVRLTARDAEALRHVVALRVVRLDDLARLLARLRGSAQPLGLRTTRDVVARWRRLGLADLHAYWAGGPGLVAATALGATWVGMDALPTGLPAWTDARHTATVAAVAVAYVVAGMRWESDAQLRQRLTQGQHRPDGIASSGEGETVAVEVERHAKSRQRWQQIVPGLLAEYGRADYWAEPAAADALRRWLPTALTVADQGRVRVVDLGTASR